MRKLLRRPFLDANIKFTLWPSPLVADSRLGTRLIVLQLFEATDTSQKAIREIQRLPTFTCGATLPAKNGSFPFLAAAATHVPYLPTAEPFLVGLPMPSA